MSVSVIMPTWNRKELLVKTLENVLGQTMPPKEVIVVDDHSTDGTIEHIRSLFKDGVIVVTNDRKGPGAARNTGLRYATGDYIKFFDSDDLMTVNTLETQVNVLKSTGKSCVYCSYFHATELEGQQWQMTDPAILQFNAVPSTHPFHHWMLRGLFVTIPSFLFTRDLLTKVGTWRTDITAYEDFDFLWRVTTHEPYPGHTNACAFLYRKHGTQTTGAHFTSSQRDREKVICFTDILSEADNTWSSVDKLIFESLVADTLRLNSDEEWTTEPGIDPKHWKYSLGTRLHRVLNKFGRMSTGTNWQPMHGPRIDNKQVASYLRMIDPVFGLKLPESKF